MTNSTHLYSQLFDFLSQYSHARDLRHLKALACRVSALLCSGELSLSAWEPYVQSRATKAQRVERRWQRFLVNIRTSVTALYVPCSSRWHYGVRLPCDVLLHGLRRYPTEVALMYPPLAEARLYRNVGLWLDGVHRTNLVLATVAGAKESWASEANCFPVLLEQYSNRLGCEQ